MNLYSIAFSLFFVLNAIGNIPIFIGLLSKYDTLRQRKIILRELLFVLLILLMCSFFGNDLLDLLGISPAIMGIAGGILLFIIALDMLFPKPVSAESSTEEPMIVPLATPLIAGPGSITAVIDYASQSADPLTMTGAIVLAWIPTTLLLLAAPNIQRLLGAKGLIAFGKIGGMLVALISAQMFTSGCIKLVRAAFFHS